MNYPELEIELIRRDSGTYAVQVRFRDPEQEAEQRADVYPITFNFEALQQAVNDPKAYGQQLGQDLLGHADLRSCMDKARTVAQSSGKRLRLRLCIDRWSSELHALRWETLIDPETGNGLASDGNILFSRFLGSFDMRPVRLRAKSALRALVAIANPSDLDQWKPNGRPLGPIDKDGELARIRESLQGVDIVEMEGAVTLDALLQQLRNDFDVVYLVCHGALINGQPQLWLEDQDGTSKRTEAALLIEGLSRLVQLPRLMVLASCQSAGTGNEIQSNDDGALAALGPRLAETGIPAVVAMQGNILQQTVAEFIPVFFRELLIDGQIDRSMAEARFAVREQPDNWAPVLYTRLITGRIWYERRFAKKDDLDIWDGLIDQIDEGKLVPVLGFGMLEPYIGTPSELAHEWAEKQHYPMAGSTYDLHQVARYISTTQGRNFALNDLMRLMNHRIEERWPALTDDSEEENGGRVHQKLLQMLSDARKLHTQKKNTEPHEVLAKLNCPLYLSATPDTLLTDALQESGKTPNIRQKWDDSEGCENSEDEMAPLVFQLFGNLNDKKKMVLTEDDYFNYMIDITRQQSRPQPSVLREKLSDSGLMFLGFRMDDWSFRTFIHLLQSLEGRSRLAGFYKNVAVQIDPEQGMGTDLAQARRYLEKYFGAPARQIEIYWGSAEDFLQELNQRCQ